MTKISNSRWRPFLAMFTAWIMILQCSLFSGHSFTAVAWANARFQGQVVEVINGATIKVQTEDGLRFVKLAGLEVQSLETPLGIQARDKLAQALIGKTVTVEQLAASNAPYHYQDNLGDSRTIARGQTTVGHDYSNPLDGRVMIDGEDIALLLLAAGLAWLLYNFLDDNLYQRQESARLEKVGVWANPQWRKKWSKDHEVPFSNQGFTTHSGNGSTYQKKEAVQPRDSGWKKPEGNDQKAYKNQEIKSHSQGKSDKSKDFKSSGGGFTKNDKGQKGDNGLHLGWEKR